MFYSLSIWKEALGFLLKFRNKLGTRAVSSPPSTGGRFPTPEEVRPPPPEGQRPHLRLPTRASQPLGPPWSTQTKPLLSLWPGSFGARCAVRCSSLTVLQPLGHRRSGWGCLPQVPTCTPHPVLFSDQACPWALGALCLPSLCVLTVSTPVLCSLFRCLVGCLSPGPWLMQGGQQLPQASEASPLSQLRQLLLGPAREAVPPAVVEVEPDVRILRPPDF